ncbi:8-amino-7-oxononanoate synthase [Persephonella sp.]
MDFLHFMEKQLEELKKKNLYRTRPVVPHNVKNFSSNDYLGLKECEKTKKALIQQIEKLSLGSGASALVSGYTNIQKKLEEEISKLKGTQSCLVVGSGYLANTGLIQAVAGEDDVIFSDSLNHASIIDGVRLSKARKVIYRHCDMNDLEDKLKKYGKGRFLFIVTDGVFSMEGDTAPLKELKYFADRYGAVLIIDDAHGTGVLGNGRGTLFHYGIQPEDNIIQVGTLSKALGSYGAFICGSKTLIDYLINRMRTQIFSTALSPIQNFISLKNLQVMEEEPFRREKVLKLAEHLYIKSKEAGINLNYHKTPILTLITGSEDKALFLRDRLLEKGFFIQAIRPPTVPEGSSRLRITISYKLTENDINLLVEHLKSIMESYHG